MKCLYRLLLLGVLGLCILGMPRGAVAKSRIELWYPLDVGVGVEGMFIDSPYYEFSHVGLNTSISAGIQWYLLFLMVDQELGYIHVRPLGGEGSRLFKGATLIDVRFFYPFLALEDHLIWGPVIKLGLGAEYMNKPDGVIDDRGMQSWFAMRIGTGIEFYFSKSIKLQAIVDYTLGVSGPNCFDGKKTTNFLGGKIVLGYVFGDIGFVL